MFWLRSSFICSLWVGFIWLFGHFIPTQMHWNLNLPLPQFPLTAKNSETAIDQKQIELDRPVIEENELLALLEKKVAPLKVFKQDDYSSFQFGQGLPLYTYLQRAQEILDSLNCPIDDGREVKAHSVLEVDFTCSSQWTGKLRFLQDAKAHQLFSQIAVVFQIDTILDISLLNELQRVRFPYTLLINPFRLEDGAEYNLKQLTNKEVLIHMPMEPQKFPYVNSGAQSLLINHNKDQIRQRIVNAIKRLPDAKAIAPYMGGRAVQHPSLMIDLFEILADKKMSYLDLHLEGRSERRAWCHQVGIECPITQAPSKKWNSLDLIERSVRNAKKNGRNILLLNADTSSVHMIQDRIDKWGDTGLELVLFSELAQTENTP